MVMRHHRLGIALSAPVLAFLLAARSSAQTDAGVPGDASASDSAVAEAGAEGGTLPAPPQILPPRLLTSTPPLFPPDKMASGEHPTVVLKVTVFADGGIGDIVVEHSAGPSFDEAARAAVRNWTFAPAQRDGVAIVSRVGVAVHFELPELGVHEVTALSSSAQAVPHAHAAEAPAQKQPAPESTQAAPPGESEEIGAHAKVAGAVRNEERSVSDFHLNAETLHAAPKQDAADLLKRAPGIVVARIEGDAVAPRLMLRGFDADHGQDIELSADGVPINQPSHIHGQGYADLGFIIPEVVRSLRVTEGVYDPRQGDFAVAGSADFELGVERRGITLASGFGSFRTYRELAVYAPEGFSADTFGAVSFRKTQGFGQNRAALQGNAMGQLGVDLGRVHLTLHASLYASRARTANVVRRDDVDAGRVGFYDVYPLASAEAQGANTQRAQISARARYRGKHGQNAELSLFFVQNEFRLQANYTGYTQISRIDPTWAGRGDLIEQQNQDRMLGLRARYRSGEAAPWRWLRAFLEVGALARMNTIAQRQNLIEAPDNTTWDQHIDADIAGSDIGGYLDLDVALFERIHLRGGVRTDLLNYRVADALANYVPAFRAETHVPGYRRSASGLAFGPRVTLQADVLRGLSLVGAYGEGYRSAMALLLDDGEPAPFTKVRSGDLGAKFTVEGAHPFSVRASGFMTQLSDDVAFDPEEGRATAVGPSRRNGVTLFADGRPLSWLYASVSATYVHAALLKPPYSSAEDPSPPFRKGQLLPYVPPVVVRGDLSATQRLARLGSHDLTGRLGAGYTYWSPRPLPYGDRASPVSLVDAELSLSYRVFRLSLSCFNLFDQRYAALELSYPSNWNPDGFASRVPARHIMAGAPRTLFGVLEIQL